MTEQIPPSETMRRQPRQVRSQQRVDAILTAAAALFDESGYDAATTNAIAARAGVPIGSLYQFFPNKDAIKDAIIRRYGEGMREILTFDTSLPPVEVMERFIDRFAAYEAEHTGFKTLFMAQDNAMLMHSEVIERVDAMLAHYFPTLTSDYVRQGAIVMVALVKTMMPLMTPPQNLPPEQVITELKLVMKGYLRGMLLRASHPLPSGL